MPTPLRSAKILLLLLTCCLFACQTPPRADLKSYLPAGTLIYLETSDLSRIGAVFTGNKYWKELSGQREGYLAFLENKQAALAVLGFQSGEAGSTLQIRPDVALVIDTQSSPSQAAAVAERVLAELSRRFSGQPQQIEKRQVDGTQWMSAPGSDDKKIYAAVAGQVILIANSENTLRLCLDVRSGKADNLGANSELAAAREQQAAADQIAFGYVSSAGVKELSDYISVAYAMKSSESGVTREMISGIVPEMLQKTVTSVVWAARATSTSVEDTYFVRTEKEFGNTVSQSVKPSASQDSCDSRYVPRSVFSATCYRLEDPRIAWRGSVLSIGNRLDQGPRKMLEGISQQLLKPYGIDDPELFLSTVGSPIVTARFDTEGNEEAAIVKVKDKDKLRISIAHTFDLNSAGELRDDALLLTSRDREFIAAFAGDTLIIGNGSAVLECLRAAKFGESFDLKFPPDISDAVVVTQQKDDSAVRIISELAAAQGQTVDVESYAIIETRIQPQGIRRKSISAFGLFGEIFRQAIE